MRAKLAADTCLIPRHLGSAATLAVCGSLALAVGVSAKTIPVNTTKDLAPKAGDCTGHAPCSVRQAVAAAASGDTVLVPSAAKRYVLTLGSIHVTQSLTILGGGVRRSVIDGHGSNGVFVDTAGTSSAPAQFRLVGLTITGSKANRTLKVGNAYSDSGAVITEGYGSLTLANCTITGNSATAPKSSSAVVGGAVDAEGGALTIAHCSITNNRMSMSAASSVGGGGVVSEGGPLKITDSNISRNRAVMPGSMPIIGGGVVSEGGTLTISRSTIANNTATAPPSSFGAGGALSDGGQSSLVNTTVSGNKISSPGTLNSGGVVADGGGVALFYDTLTRNAGGVGTQLVAGSGPYQPFGSVLALAPKGKPDCKIVGTSASKGYNFSDQSTCALTGPHDRTHGNPRLAVLALGGGPGPTVAPLPGSPLIDFIPGAQCASGITTDERRRPRPDDGEHACDIGAYEVQDK